MHYVARTSLTLRDDTGISRPKDRTRPRNVEPRISVVKLGADRTRASNRARRALRPAAAVEYESGNESMAMVQTAKQNAERR
jgi:hypothetical protein